MTEEQYVFEIGLVILGIFTAGVSYYNFEMFRKGFSKVESMCEWLGPKWTRIFYIVMGGGMIAFGLVQIGKGLYAYYLG